MHSEAPGAGLAAASRAGVMPNALSAREFRVRLRDFRARVRVTYEGRADGDAQGAVGRDVGGTDRDRRVEPALPRGVLAEQGQGARVVTAAGRLVRTDHAARALEWTAGDGRGEHGAAEGLAHLLDSVPTDLDLRVGQVRHVAQIGTVQPDVPVGDGAEHLQLLVHNHRQLVALLGVREEVQQAVRVRSGGGIAVGAADRVHHDFVATHPYVRLGAGADQGVAVVPGRVLPRPAVPRGLDRAGVDAEGPVRAGLRGQQAAEEAEEREGRGRPGAR